MTDVALLAFDALEPDTVSPLELAEQDDDSAHSNTAGKVLASSTRRK